MLAPDLPSDLTAGALQILKCKASDVVAGMRSNAILRQLSADGRKPVDTGADYLLKY